MTAPTGRHPSSLVRRGCAASAAAAVVILGSALWASPAAAHPLGNFTVNTYNGLRISADRVAIDLVVDMAEIPTFQARRQIDRDRNGTVDAAESTAHAERACGQARGQVKLEVGGRTVAVKARQATLEFPEGAAGLPTLRLSCEMEGLIAPGAERASVAFANTYMADRVGWREITATGDQMTIVETNVPARSVSDRLRTYPEDLLELPLDQRQARLVVDPGGGESAPAAAERPGSDIGRLDATTRAFTSLVSRQSLTLGFGLLALLVAGFLGGLHALAPGHGKTLMAAYLVAQQGSRRDVAIIGLTVTATHTSGVMVLGVVLSASTTLAPESIYPWLGAASGLLLVGIGASLVVRSLRSDPLVPALIFSDASGAGSVKTKAGAPLVLVAAPSHHAGHDHADHDHADHDHHDHDHHDHDHHDHDHAGQPHRHGLFGHAHAHPSPRVGRGWRSLVPMGLAGGMVPSPSALVVLLGSIALGRAWFGLALVVAYGVGMAATLMAAGLILVKARGAIEARLRDRRSQRWLRLAPYLPVLSASAIVIGGIYLTGRSLTSV
ncbi:MAG: nickel/cobalt transporter [Acidimicrobiales bacterium]